MGDAGGDAAAELVGAEQVLAEGLGEGLADGAEGIAGEEHRCAQRDRQHEGQQYQAQHRRAVAQEQLPEAALLHQSTSIRGSRKV